MDFEKKNYNGKRSSTVTMLSKQNINLSKEISEYISKKDLLTDELNSMLRLHKNINECAAFSQYRKQNGKFTYIGSHTCDSRLCNICNWKRKKKIRRLYLRFFKENRQLIITRIGKKANKTIVTESVYKRKFESNGIVEKREYDLMHLTLTLPHYKNEGYKGNVYYFGEIIALFNKMRKRKEWLKWVYGGEYGAEATNGDNGFNIHIHSLLFVRKATKSRNFLHKVITEIWNEITAGSVKNPKQFTSLRISKLKESNSFFNDEFIKSLDISGATVIGLETIYSVIGGEKVRSSQFSDDAMMKAVMETISYHFKPKMFNKAEKKFDLDMIRELLPRIHKQKLYGRFGCIQNEDSLSLCKKEAKSELSAEYEDTKESGSEVGFDEDAEHYIVRPFKVFHDIENDNEIQILKSVLDKSIKLNALNTSHAIDLMNDMVKKSKKHQS